MKSYLAIVPLPLISVMATSGRAGGLALSSGKMNKSGQTRSTVGASQTTGKIQTTLTSASRRAGAGASATAPLQSRKSSLVSTASSTASVGVSSSTSTAMNQRGLKLRPTNPSVLPVLCVYSDQNQLVRKEQFRIPPAAPVKPKLRSNNENLLSASRPSHIPVAQTQARAMSQLSKSTISSTARVGSNNTTSSSGSTNINGAKRSKMTVPRSTTAKVSQPVASSSSNKGNIPISFFQQTPLFFFRNERVPRFRNSRLPLDGRLLDPE